MQEIRIEKKDVIVMKLLHYFITEEDYNPVILHGAKDEIWLENMESNYKIVRIVSGHIHNVEQFNFDVFKTKKIVSSIKKKTYSLNMNVLNIFTDIDDDVALKDEKNMDFAIISTENDLKKYNFLYDYFPNIDKKLTFTEKGIELFMKITNDINQKNIKEAAKAEKIFSPKKIIVTYILIAINIILFVLSYVVPGFFNKFFVNGVLIRAGEYFRLITGTFLHAADPFHIFFNMYALNILGSQVESFFGKFKMIVIYLVSCITGSLLSIMLNGNSISVGASGAIFGLLGALLYFGYYYRVYFGSSLINQILPIIIINLGISLFISNIDIFAHIGGLIGGYLTARAIGIPDRSDNSQKINGIITLSIFVGFLIFMNFFVIK